MLRAYFRTIVAALVIGADIALLIVFLNMTGWLEASSSVAPTATQWPTPTAVSVAQPSPTPRTASIHVVKSGEVLAEIAKRYGVSVQDIVRASGLSDPNALRVGQPLTIPVAPAR